MSVYDLLIFNMVSESSFTQTHFYTKFKNERLIDVAHSEFSIISDAVALQRKHKYSPPALQDGNGPN